MIGPFPGKGTLVRRAPSTGQTGLGEKLLVEVSRSDVDVEVQQTDRTEVLVDRDTVATGYRAFLPPTAAPTALDLLEVDGVTYEVVGRPDLIRDPFTGGRPDHWELRLRESVG